MAIMDIPQSFGKSSSSFLATKTQKTAMGAVIRNMVSIIDLASGPNISLPPQRNTCQVEDTEKEKR